MDKTVVSTKKFLKDNWLLVIALIYVFIRTDLVPDTIPLIGSLDDSLLVFIDIIRRYVEFRKESKPKTE